MFSKKKLHDTKHLLEGEGMKLKIKFEHEFKGFLNCYTLLTCNNLPYPFIPPNSSLSGFTEDEWINDKPALELRTSIVRMEKSYDESNEFPFT